MIYKKARIFLIGWMTFFSLSSLQAVSFEGKVQQVDSTSQGSSFSPSSIIESVIKYGKSFLYTPYHFGSSNGMSFDCSGFTSYIYNSFGYKLDHSSSGQANQFPAVDRKQLKPGDLVYFSGHRRGKNRIGHVGMVVSTKDDGTFEFIHAATSRGITISSSEEPYYAQRYIKANRVVGSNPIIDGAASLKKDNVLSELTSVPFVEPMTQVSQKTPAKYHKVKKGETLKSIAKKYGITQDQLMALNHMRKSKISKGQQILIAKEENVRVAEPIKKETSLLVQSKPTTSLQSNDDDDDDDDNAPSAGTKSTHLVKKGESLFSIAKQYNITVQQLKASNNLSSEGIKAGQSLNIDVIPVVITTPVAKENKSHPTVAVTHKVKKGETLFSIANQYKMSVEDIKKINKIEGSGIRYGQELKLAVSSVEDQKSTVTEKAVVEKATPTKSKTTHHKVKKGETLYSIAKKYGCTIAQLKEWNPGKGDKLAKDVSLNILQSNK